jgi:hypothetical protein
MNKKQPTTEKASPPAFEGFPTPTKNFFSMPNDITNIIADITNMAELKVIIYVIRHTWGFHEYGKPKAISVDEFMRGRKRQDGKTRMDTGTGMAPHSVIEGLKRAVEHGYIICEIDSSDMARIKKSYALKMIGTSADAIPGAEFAPPEEFAPGAECDASSADLADRGAESAPRSEKYTNRNTPKKEIESTYPRVEQSDDSDSTIVSPTHALSQLEKPQGEPDVPTHPSNARRPGAANPNRDHLQTEPDEPAHGTQPSQPSQVDSPDADRIAPAAQLSTISATYPQQSAKVEKPARALSEKKPTQIPKPQLTLLGGQVRDWYEVIRATKLRMTPKNVSAFNVLSELDGMDFVSLKEVLDLFDADTWIKNNNIPTGPQELASEDGKWSFDRWLPVVVRNRAKCAAKSSPKSNIDQEMEASRRAMREINAKEKARSTR